VYQVFASISEPVALSPREALDSAEALMAQQGYNVTERTDTSVTAVRRKREGLFGHSLRDLTVVAQPLPQGGVQIKLKGNDREGARNRQAEWSEWGKSLPKLKDNQQKHDQRPRWHRTVRPQRQDSPVGDAGSNDRGHAPVAEPGGWSSAAPWKQEPRVAPSKRTTDSMPPQDTPKDTSENSSGDVRQRRKGAKGPGPP
jgi:hypothetical protein